jgi:hypothetical protein
MRASTFFVGALAIIGCERGPSSVFCGTPTPKPGEGLNPLIEDRAVCYDDRATCERATDDCSGHRPGWSCTTLQQARPTTDPLAGISECWPSTRLCEASRTRWSAAGDCTSVDQVYCSTTNHALSCYISERDCGRAGELVSQVLHVDKARCASRRD